MFVEAVAAKAAEGATSELVKQAFSKSSAKETLEAFDELRSELQKHDRDQARIDILSVWLWGVPAHARILDHLLSPTIYSTELIRQFREGGNELIWDESCSKVGFVRRRWQRQVEKYILLPISISQILCMVVIVILVIKLFVVDRPVQLGALGIAGIIFVVSVWAWVKMLNGSAKVWTAESLAKSLNMKSIPSPESERVSRSIITS